MDEANKNLSGEDVRRLSRSLIKRATAFMVVALEGMDDGTVSFACNAVNLTKEDDARHIMLNTLFFDTRSVVAQINRVIREQDERNRVRALKEKRSADLDQYKDSGFPYGPIEFSDWVVSAKEIHDCEKHFGSEIFCGMLDSEPSEEVPLTMKEGVEGPATVSVVKMSKNDGNPFTPEELKDFGVEERLSVSSCSVEELIEGDAEGIEKNLE